MSFSLDQAVKTAGLTLADDVSACLPADATEVIIEGGPYKLDADALRRLTTLKVSGGGSVMWADFRAGDNTHPDPFTGVIPVAKLRDPLLLSVAMPSEAPTFMHWRVNATNLFATEDKHVKSLAIGAVYRNENDKPADSDPVTICFSDITMLFHSAKTGWFLADHIAAPIKGMVSHMYYLPWTLEPELGHYDIPDERIALFDDHIEVHLTGATFNGTEFRDERIQETCLHIWARNVFFADFALTGSEVDGIAVAYRSWVKEPGMAGKFVAAIGADLREENNRVDQSFSGRNFLLTNEPRWILGHNVGPKAYDAVMDSEKVQQLIGMK